MQSFSTGDNLSPVDFPLHLTFVLTYSNTLSTCFVKEWIVEYIVHNGMMKDLSVLQESPFTDQGSIVEIFTDMNVWMGIRKVIDNINANAAA